MKRHLICAALMLWAGSVAAQTTISAGSNAGSTASSNTNSSSGSTAQSGMMSTNITFEGSQTNDHQRVDTTPNIYIAPSMFGGANNCGQSSSVGVGVTGFGIGGSLASESKSCNAREDTATAYRLGYKEVADLRFFCFGEKENRKAWEAAGHSCPGDTAASGATTSKVSLADERPKVAAEQAQTPAPRQIAAAHTFPVYVEH